MGDQVTDDKGNLGEKSCRLEYGSKSEVSKGAKFRK